MERTSCLFSITNKALQRNLIFLLIHVLIRETKPPNATTIFKRFIHNLPKTVTQLVLCTLTKFVHSSAKAIFGGVAYSTYQMIRLIQFEAIPS